MTEQTLRDYLTAVLVVSTVVFALTPVFFGFAMQQKGCRLPQVIFVDFPLILSFLTGIGAIIYVIDWFGAPLSSAANGYKDSAATAFWVQLVTFSIGGFAYWISALVKKWSGS